MITTSLIPIDEVVYFDVCTHAPSTGAVSDADSTPTFDVFEEATDTAILSAQSFTKRTSLTGDYRGTFTASAANGFEAGKWYSVIASATVGGVAAKKNCGSFRCAPAENAAGAPIVDARTYAVASVTGNVGGNVTGSVGSVVGAVGSVTGAVGSVTGNVGGNVTGSVGSVATGGITAASFAAGAIDAAAIAADAIGSSELAATAASEIATAVRTELGTELGRVDVAVSTRLASASYTAPLDAAGVRTAVGLASANLDTQLSAIAGYIDTEVAAILTKIGTPSADLAADIAAIYAKVDSEVAAILAAVDTEVAAIKAKTDNLTFTSGTDLDVNVQKVNDVALTGVGTSGDPWGPV